LNRPRYPFPLRLAAKIAWSALRGEARSFAEDARRLTAALPEPLQVRGRQHIPTRGPLLVTCNHYTRPGLPAWWMTLAISAVLPYPVHWIVTSAFTFHGHPLLERLTPLTSLAMRRLALVYDFSLMPPMPPAKPTSAPSRAANAALGASAVRQVLRRVKADPQAVIGLAPEGRDSTDLSLLPPLPGVGRFVNHLSCAGLEILPAGLFEDGRALVLHFGLPYRLDLPAGLSPAELDAHAAVVVMSGIAALLPAEIRGIYA
jgi:1-acyl-sn-glycerol-3-phosphate acyltransferase